MPCNTRIVIALGAVVAAAPSSLAQSINIDWGDPLNVPSPSYAAVGEAGVWNGIGTMPFGGSFTLVGLDGQPIGARIRNIGFDVIQSADIPGATGDDEALLEDCYASQGDTLDGCLFIDNVEPGEYLVILYGLAPDDDTLLSPLRIDQNAEPPELVGGAWTGAHTDGVTYMAQIATVGPSRDLDFHSGQPGNPARAVLNAMQIVRLDQTCDADFAEPFGSLDFNDVVAFLTAFSVMDPDADLAAPIGAFDFNDVVAYLTAFAAGCP